MAHDKLRFVTVAGNVEFNIPPDQPFDMVQQMNALRSSGFLMNESCYIPISSILAVFTFDSTLVEAPNAINLSSDKGKLN